MRWRKKRNMFQSPINVSACSHVKSISFATFFLKCFVAETKKNSNQFGFFLFVSAAEILCCKWENMRKPTCPGTLSRFSKTFLLLSNQIHRKFKTNQNILSKTSHNKMADSENVQPKEKLSDEEKQLLSFLINKIKHSDLQK